MTDLERRYRDLRINRRIGHVKAIRMLAKEIGVDERTVKRVLDRAEREAGTQRLPDNEDRT